MQIAERSHDLATLIDIAKAAGVSTGVVSRVVNGDETLRIGKETRKRVLRIIAELDYSPNVAARSLRSASSGVLALVVHDISNFVYREILDGAQLAAGRLGKALVITDASSSSESANGLLRLINGGGLDGLIIQGGGKDADEIIARAAKRNMPIVALQARLDTKAHLLRLPDREAAKIAAEHLRSLGHGRVGCIATARGLTFTDERLRGIRQIFPDLDENDVVYSLPKVEAGEHASAQLLDRRKDLTSMICLNVLCGVGTLRTVRKRGLKTPDDMSIIAVHELELAQDLATPLTTVQMPLFELGRAAVEKVVSGTVEPNGETVIDTRPKLISRASTASRRW